MAADLKNSQKSQSASKVMMTPIFHMQKSHNYLIIVYLVKKFTECAHSNLKNAYWKAKEEEGKSDKEAVLEAFA